MFSVISGQYWFVFSVNFNNTTCIWNKTTRVLKLWWMCVQKSHAIWKNHLYFVIWSCNKSDTGSGCNEVSRNQRRRDAENDSRVYDALKHILLNNESDLRERTSYFDVSQWFTGSAFTHTVDLTVNTSARFKVCVCVCVREALPSAGALLADERSLHLFVWPHQYFSSSDNTESDSTRQKNKPKLKLNKLIFKHFMHLSKKLNCNSTLLKN